MSQSPVCLVKAAGLCSQFSLGWRTYRDMRSPTRKHPASYECDRRKNVQHYGDKFQSAFDPVCSAGYKSAVKNPFCACDNSNACDASQSTNEDCRAHKLLVYSKTTDAFKIKCSSIVVQEGIEYLSSVTLSKSKIWFLKACNFGTRTA